MSIAEINLSPSTTTGTIGIMHIKRYWEKCVAKRTGKLAPDALPEEWNTDITMLAALGLGLEQTLKYVYLSAAGFAEFEQWVREVNNGMLLQEKIEAFNASLLSNEAPASVPEKFFSSSEIDFWNDNGYIIIRQAVSKADCEATIDVICDFLSIKRDDPLTWYAPHPAKQGIMIQLFQHPILERNRQSQKIRLAYEHLWNRKDIWINTDRVGFNPPETGAWKFPGPKLHWDVSLQLPIPFGLQGILYLADTAANQGAFTLVPGFHNRIAVWLNSLPPSVNPRTENLQALGAIPVVANAGDFIIWHQALPHGSSANNSLLPRFVQYINYAPLDMEVREKWI
jgi:Phytanoyl-CoA dioxygenase (PhyH)